MSVFYFLPVLLGFSAGKRFGASPYLSALLGACLLYLTSSPSWATRAAP